MTSSPVQKPRRSLTIATVLLGIAVIVTAAFWIRNAQTAALASVEKKRQAERFLVQAGYWQHLTSIEKAAIVNAPKGNDDLSEWKGWLMILTTHGLDAAKKNSRSAETYWNESSERIFKLPVLGVDVELADYANRRADLFRTKALHYGHEAEALEYFRVNWAGLNLITKLFDPNYQKRVDEFKNVSEPVRAEEGALEKKKLELDVLRAYVRGILSRRYSSEFLQ